MGAVAGFVAIGLGKAIFGGIGHNLFNPALVGRAFVQARIPLGDRRLHALVHARAFHRIHPVQPGVRRS